MDSEYDTDTAVRRDGDGRFVGAISDRWDVGAAPNGGYVLAVALRALAGTMPHPDPLTITGHYVRRAEHAPAEIRTRVIRAGRTVSTGEARLAQQGKERLRLLATFGDLAAATGPTHLAGGPPQLPPPEECPAGEAAIPGGGSTAIADRLDLRFPPGMPGWRHGRPSGVAELHAWLRLADGRDADTLALVLLVDCLPPPVFELGIAGWVPTVELTCHVRGRPARGWLRCAVRTRFLQDGLLDEEVEIWDADDRIVALARQLAMLPPTS